MSPKGKPPGRGGMGNPYEEGYFYEGWRDYGQGEPRPKDVVFDPGRNPVSSDPERQGLMDDFFNRFREELKRPLVFFSKRPAFVEPPFFSKPIIKAKCGLTVAPGATEIIFDRLIEDRQRAIIANIGIDVEPIAPLFNCQLEFWFQLDDDVIPLFDDQTPTAYGATTPLIYGRTTVLPGSVEIPFCLMGCGLAFGVHGRKRLTFRVENKSGVTITTRGILGFYQYWSSGPDGASEFEQGDFQV